MNNILTKAINKISTGKTSVKLPHHGWANNILTKTINKINTEKTSVKRPQMHAYSFTIPKEKSLKALSLSMRLNLASS